MKTTQTTKIKLKKGDNVIVLTGKDKGKTGVIAKVIRETNQVLVDGVNTKKRHTKSRQQGQSGQIIEKAHPIHVSNVAIVDPKSKKTTKIGYSILKDGKKVRIAKKSGTELK